MTLAWIVAACFAGGLLSVGLAAAFALTVRASWVPMLVSYAIGALLGAAFLEVIPHAFERVDAHTAALTILAGIFVFFILEKLVLWRHCHTEDCEAHDHHAEAHDHGRSGMLILVGDTVHNFIDGVLIAAAFLESTQLGVITAIAIFAAAALGDLATYVMTSLQLAIAFPDPVGGVAGAASKFLGIFAITQIPLAISEGLLTVIVWNLLAKYSKGELAILAKLKGRVA